MSAEIVSIEINKPHLTICTDGQVHVVPISLALKWCSGEAELPCPAILRRIIVEWLACVQAGWVEIACTDLDNNNSHDFS